MACTSSSKMVRVRGEKDFNKKSCGGSENFDLKRGCSMEWVNFLKGLQVFGENRKLHNSIIIN